jgi:hypothetical protein
VFSVFARNARNARVAESGAVFSYNGAVIVQPVCIN